MKTLNFDHQIQSAFSKFNEKWLKADKQGRKELEDKACVDCTEISIFARRKLVNMIPYIAESIYSMPIVAIFDHRIQTLATNGKMIFINPIFFLALDIDGQIFVLAHEVWHCLLLHIKRRDRRDPKIWNLAIDHEVNFLLMNNHFPYLENSVFFKQWSGECAEKIYEHLLEYGQSGNQSSFDQHLSNVGEFDQNLKNKFKEIDFILNANQLDAMLSSLDDHTTSETQLNIEWQLKALSVYRTMKSQGYEPGRAFSSIVISLTEPQVPWQTLIKSLITQSFGGSLSWQKFNRRLLHQGIYLPSIRSTKISIAVAIDTSGSISNEDINTFINEINYLVQSFGHYEILFYQCDCEIKERKVFSNQGISFEMNKFSVQGRGGTSFIPVFEDLVKYKQKHGSDISCLVYFTDGCGLYPLKPNFPVFWLITPGGECDVDWGKKVYLN
jgi:predicted metal-dependent peptidase